MEAYPTNGKTTAKKVMKEEPVKTSTTNPKKNFNPFYGLLIIVGIAFCVTAFAYGVMTVRELQPAESLGQSSQSGLKMMNWIDNNGFQLMMVELVALAFLTFAAIGTDEYWTKREAQMAAANVDSAASESE